MSLEGLLLEKFGNFVRRYEKELDDLALACPDQKPVKEWSLKDLVQHALTLQPYWCFIEEGQFDAVVEMAALTEHPVAELGVTLYYKLTEGRRERLHRYLAFFLHGIQELIKNAGHP